MTNLLLYATTVLIWGSTWFAIEFQLGTVPVEASLVYRYVLASALLFAWCALRRRSLRFDRSAHGRFMLLGISLFGLNYLLAYNAQFHISSALNAIAFSSMLWMNLFNTRLFLGVRSDRRTLVGAVLGILGIGVLFWPEVSEFGLTDATATGAALALSGAYVASLGNVLSQRTQSEGLPVLQSNTWGMFYGAMFTGIYALARDVSFVFDPAPAYWLSLAYLALFGSVIAFGAYLTLLGRIGAQRAGSAVVMFPIVALILSTAFEGLEIQQNVLLGTGLALTGNALVLTGRRQGKKDQRPVAPAKRRPRNRSTTRHAGLANPVSHEGAAG